MDPASKDLLDFRGLVLRKLNIKLIHIEICIRSFVVAKVIVEARQIIDSILPHNEVCTPADSQEKLYELLSIGFPLLLER